jgi:uncharacterized protein DUF6789
MSNHIDFGKGIVSGVIATVVLSALLLLKQATGFMPEMSPIQMIMQTLGTQSQAVGWAVHFFIGTIVWGVLYAWFDSVLPGPHWFRGGIFAMGAWLIVVIFVMPIVGMKLFGLQMGGMAAIGLFVMHWIYGAVLGGVYGAWTEHQPSETIRGGRPGHA